MQHAQSPRLQPVVSQAQVDNATASATSAAAPECGVADVLVPRSSAAEDDVDAAPSAIAASAASERGAAVPAAAQPLATQPAPALAPGPYKYSRAAMLAINNQPDGAVNRFGFAPARPELVDLSCEHISDDFRNAVLSAHPVMVPRRALPHVSSSGTRGADGTRWVRIPAAA